MIDDKDISVVIAPTAISSKIAILYTPCQINFDFMECSLFILAAPLWRFLSLAFPLALRSKSR